MSDAETIAKLKEVFVNGLAKALPVVVEYGTVSEEYVKVTDVMLDTMVKLLWPEDGEDD